MPPRTRSSKMVGTSVEGEETSMSHPKPEGDFLSIMAKMMEDFKDLKKDIQEEMKGFKERNQAIQSSLLKKITALKEERKSRPPTPRGNHLPHVVPEEHVEVGGYDEWHGRVGIGNVGRGPFGGGYERNERFGMGNQRGKVEPYGDRFRGDYESRYHEDGLDRRSGGKKAPKSHGEWHSRRDRDNVSRKGFERPIEAYLPTWWC